MTFKHQNLDELQETPGLIRTLNETFRRIELAFENTAVTKPRAAPGAPYEGMIAYADGINWVMAGGPGAYIYAEDMWVKLGLDRKFPKVFDYQDRVATGTYNVVGGDITDPPTVLNRTGAGASITVLLLTGRTVGDRIGVRNGGDDTHTVNISATATMTLSLYEAVMFEWNGTGWLPL